MFHSSHSICVKFGISHFGRMLNLNMDKKMSRSGLTWSRLNIIIFFVNSIRSL